MKKTDPTLTHDVETLVKQSTVAEAVDNVWKRLEQALYQLDPESLLLLRQHFEGADAKVLSQRWNLTEKEIDEWLRRKKKELIHHLRNKTALRQ